MSIKISLPSSPASSPPGTPRKTNTLIVTSLPQELFQAVALDALRNHFASYGCINQWAPISAFRRVIIVYETEDAAESAKRQSDPIMIEQTSNRPRITLRVYRADRNPLLPTDSPTVIPQSAYLRPPAIEKNFLISPPGSPPAGWEQVREDPPNTAPLAVDLIEALRKLQMRNGAVYEVLLEPEGGHGVGVFVEDCDSVKGGGLEWRGYGDDDEEDWAYGDPSPRIKWKALATALPPLPTAVM